MTAPTETGLCRRGTRCADARHQRTTHDDNTTTVEYVPARATTPGGLCRIDTDHTLRAIEQLPRDYVELSLLLGKTSRTLDAPTGGTRELPVPIRLGVEALQAEIAWELTIWGSVVAERDGFEFPHRARPAHRVRHAVGWLTGRWPTLLTLPTTAVVRLDGRDERLSGRSTAIASEEDGVDGALRLLWLHDRAMATGGHTRRVHRLWSPCPRCQTLALRREEGSPWVDCACCAHRMSLDAYEELADVLAHAYRPEAAA